MTNAPFRILHAFNLFVKSALTSYIGFAFYVTCNFLDRRCFLLLNALKQNVPSMTNFAGGGNLQGLIMYMVTWLNIPHTYNS